MRFLHKIAIAFLTGDFLSSGFHWWEASRSFTSWPGTTATLRYQGYKTYFHQ